MMREIAENKNYDFAKTPVEQVALGLAPINEKAYTEEMKLWKQAQTTDAGPKHLAKVELSSDFEIQKESAKDGYCVLGIYPGKDKSVQMIGKDCEFTIVPKTQDDIKKEKASEDFWNSPEGINLRERMQKSIQG